MPNEIETKIIEAIAEVRAVPEEALREEIESIGLDEIMLSSHEVVTVLVFVQDETGIDPTDADVLKGCEVQSISQLIDFITSRMNTQ